MKSTKVVAPTETPEEKAARLAAEQQATNDRISSTQDLLSSDTNRRLRRFGLASQGSSGSVPLLNPTSAANVSVAAFSGGSSLFTPLANGGNGASGSASRGNTLVNY